MARWLEAWPSSGFYSSPPTLVAPRNENAYVILENAGNCTVEAQPSANFSILPVFLGSRRLPLNQSLYEMRGTVPGTVVVRARTATGQIYAELRVLVKAIKQWKLKFHFVTDSATHTTRRSQQDFEPRLHGGLTEARTVQGMNRVYTPQAAIEIVSLGTAPAQFSTDLGRMILDRGANTPAVVPANWAEWDYIRSRNDQAADVNVYFVWRVEQTDIQTTTLRRLFRRDSADALTETPGDTCIFEDGLPADTFLPTLCHEIGHSLGLDDDLAPTARRRVMYGFTVSYHPARFTLAEVLTINP